jgi:general secretion pathway protein A
MYKAHFGLKSRPFGSNAEGPSVFTGPQQARITKTLHKALATPDAVVTVTGPAGVGKTTIVGKALESITPNRMAAWVGRMQLAPDEVLDLLLAGFGVRTKATGTIRRFAVFRRLLAERAAAGAPVTIVVEDAQRLGADTLVEIEALTAADAGDSTAANIILMGPDLNKLLAEPDLARLKQRSRLRQKVEPFGQAEVIGYLKHAIRQAGGNYDDLFDPGVDQIVFGCSEGIPRMINTLCESALEAALEEGKKSVSAALMHQVATETFGYEGPLPDVVEARPAKEPDAVKQADTGAQPEPATSAEAEIDWEAPPVAENTNDAPAENDSTEFNEEDLPAAARNIVVESGHYPELPDIPEDSPLVSDAEPVAESKSAPGPDANNDDIPHLIEDTQPELSTLPIHEPELPEPDPVDPDAGSTAIQEKPDGIELAAAAAMAEREQATPAASTSEPKENSGNFDLDAALSIDADETNIMEGIAPNLDNIAKQNKPVEAESEAGQKTQTEAPDSLDDLPTLSNSMRVDVGKEVKRAKQIEAAAEPTPAAKPKPEPEPEPEASMVLEPEPELVAALPDAPKPLSEPEPEPEPAPKTSEMTARIAALDPNGPKNDVDALQAALDAAKTGKLDDLMAPPQLPSVSGNGAAQVDEEAPVAIPEITLDNKLAEKQKPSAVTLEAAAEISKANSLEEFSDTMAETLFGNEDLNAIAAEVMANPPPDAEIADPEPVGPSPVQLEEPELALATVDSAALELEDKSDSMPTPPVADGGLRESQAMRADMLRALQNDPDKQPAENIELTHEPEAPRPAAPNPHQPVSIEDQINTSMTQNMEALNVAKMADSIAEEEEEKPAKKSGGLFSRFRKSS